MSDSGHCISCEHFRRTNSLPKRDNQHCKLSKGGLHHGLGEPLAPTMARPKLCDRIEAMYVYNQKLHFLHSLMNVILC